MERGEGGGNDRGPDLAAVSRAMPCERERRRCGAGVGPGARLSVGLALPLVAPVGAGVQCRRAFGRRERHERMREPMERGEGGGNDRRPDLAAVSRAMPCEPHGRRVALGRIRSSASASVGPSACARLSVGFPVPLVAAIVGACFGAGLEWRLALDPAGEPVHDRARGARALPI